MSYQYFIPRAEGARNSWLINFNAKLIHHADTFSISDETLEMVLNFKNTYSYSLALTAASYTFDRACVSYKDQLDEGELNNLPVEIPEFTIPLNRPSVAVTPGIFKILGHLIQTIKAHPAYTTDIGKDLGVIGADKQPTGGIDALKVELKVRIVAGKAVVSYKRSILDGIVLECKRSEEERFTILNRFNKLTYTDKRDNLELTKPEIRQYRASGIIKDEIVGILSDIVSITVNPK